MAPAKPDPVSFLVMPSLYVGTTQVHRGEQELL
jgi:hypothetical protein